MNIVNNKILNSPCIVISQSMYFPWKGYLELISLADIFVIYDDVQFSKGSFTNRVQIKSPNGKQSWLTIPMEGLKSGQKINEIFLKNINTWSHPFSATRTSI